MSVVVESLSEGVCKCVGGCIYHAERYVDMTQSSCLVGKTFLLLMGYTLCMLVFFVLGKLEPCLHYIR